MFIFYDTETSSKEVIGQILSYSFILTKADLSIQSELNGTIQLNRTQLPDVDAIWVNQINIEDLQATGDPEYRAAEKIYTFLNHVIERYGSATLVGFNSNQFDLQFIRNLMIRYGYNPYFFGKIKNLDVLHFAKHLAVLHQGEFPLEAQLSETGESYYSFKLETLARVFGILDAPQTHEARADVVLTMALVKALEARYHHRLIAFQPVQFLSEQGGDQYIAREDTPNGPIFWSPYRVSKKGKLLLNLTKYASLDEGESPLLALKYHNPNKHFLVLSALSSEEDALWTTVLEHAMQDMRLSEINSLDDYLALTKKNWDIEYQIHAMGFERIEILKTTVQQLLESPHTYEATLAQLLQERQKNKNNSDAFEKDNYLIQLYNRAYLNWHPDPPLVHLQRYLFPRYVAGTLLRDPAQFHTLDQSLTRLRTLQTEHGHTPVLAALERYYIEFITKFNLV